VLLASVLRWPAAEEEEEEEEDCTALVSLLAAWEEVAPAGVP
jgi:hypothetical protein